MRKNRPWYWSDRRAWYATIDRRRVRLVVGPKDAATEALAVAEYKKLTTPPELRPEVVEKRIRTDVERQVRERIDEVFREGIEHGREEGVLIGRMAALFTLIEWIDLIEDCEAGTLRPGAEQYIDLEIWRSVGMSYTDAEKELREAKTAGAAERLLLDRVGLRPHGVKSGWLVVRSLSMLGVIYPLLTTADVLTRSPGPPTPGAAPRKVAPPVSPPEKKDVWQDVLDDVEGDSAEQNGHSEYRHRRSAADARGRRVVRKKPSG